MNHALQRSCVLVLFLAFGALQGCQSTRGAERVDQTSVQMGELRSTVEGLQGAVGKTADALSAVVETGASDPQPALAELRAQVKAVSKSSKSARSRLQRVQKDGNRLFESWTKQVDTIFDADLRSASEKRRDELQARLAGVAEELEPLLAEVDEFVALAVDFDTYLSQDATPVGIKTVADKATDLTKSGRSIADDLEDAASAIGKAAAHFATAKPPEK